MESFRFVSDHDHMLTLVYSRDFKVAALDWTDASVHFYAGVTLKERSAVLEALASS